MQQNVIYSRQTYRKKKIIFTIHIYVLRGCMATVKNRYIVSSLKVKICCSRLPNKFIARFIKGTYTTVFRKKTLFKTKKWGT